MGIEGHFCVLLPLKPPDGLVLCVQGERAAED